MNKNKSVAIRAQRIRKSGSVVESGVGYISLTEVKNVNVDEIKALSDPNEFYKSCKKLIANFDVGSQQT